MFRIQTESELLEAFRPIDRDQVELPVNFQFPMGIKDYLVWVEGSGNRIFLILQDPGKRLPLGIVFRRDQSGGSESSMCEWCLTVRPANEVSLLTAVASSKRRVGLHLCRDLECGKRPLDYLSQTTEFSRNQKIIQRMLKFAKRTLF